MESTKNRLKKARDLYKSGEFAQAEALCEEILDAKADSYEACLLLGKVAYSLGNNEKAEKNYIRAQSINGSHPPAWQGLAEVYQRTDDFEKAIPVLRKLVALMEEDDVKNQGFALKLAKALAQAGQPEESTQILEGILNHVGLIRENHLLALCQLADIQLTKDDSLLDARVCEIFSSHEGLPDALEENLDPAGVKARVMGEYMEQSLHGSPVCKTLKSIIQTVAPFPAYLKYYDSYLLMFCKAIYCAGAQSVIRYNLRIQTLEQCYKMIFGKSGGCCTPLPFITALRLLEIKEEIMHAHRQAATQDPGTLDASRRTSSTGSATLPFSTLHNLPAASDPSIEDKSIPSRWEKEQSHVKIQLGTLSRLGSFDDDDEFSPAALSPSKSRSLVGSPYIRSIHLRSSDTGCLPPVMETESQFLPTFMRSDSLAVVRKLHKLGSSVLCGAGDIIGDDVPRLLEVTEQVGCRMIHMFPWEAESGVQLALALCRRKIPPEETKTVDVQERRVTDFQYVPKQMTRVCKNLKAAITQLLKVGMQRGSKSAIAIIATVKLMTEEEHYIEALEMCEQGVSFLHDRGARGGYPMAQASLTLQLNAANALLRLSKLDEAEERFKHLIDTVSEGEVSFGVMAGLATSSIRQSAHRGLAHVSLARGNLIAARQKYEELLGASLLGKGPSVYWAEAEYGWILYEDGDTVRAKSHLERAVILVEDCPSAETSCIGEYSFKLAKVYWSLGSKWRSNKAFAHTQLMKAAKFEGIYQADAFALLGIFYLEEETDKQKSRKCFQRALSLNPGQCEAGSRLLDMLISSGTPLAKLLNFCKGILERDPAAEWALEGHGCIAHELGDFQSAIVSFKTALKKRLDNTQLWERMGAAYQGMGRLTSSIKSFNRAIELDSTRLYSLVQAGQLHAQLGEHSESIARFQQALDLDDSYPPTLLGMASTLLTLSRSYTNLGAVRIAAELANQARELAYKCTREHGNVKLGWKLLGDIDYLHHSIHKEASATFGEERPKSARDIVSGLKADVQRSCTRVRGSRRSYAHAVHLDPGEGTSWGDMASSCFQEARLQELLYKEGSREDVDSLRMLSEKLLRAGVFLDPTCVHLWEALGNCSKDIKVREYALHRALQISPKLVKAWVALAKLYQDCGEHTLAEQCLEHARSHDPSAVSIWEGMAALATYQSPLDLFEHSLGLGGSPQSFLGFALHAVHNGRAKEPEVYACATKAVENFPLHSIAHHARGLCEEFRGFPLRAVLSYDISLLLLRGEKGANVSEGDWESLTEEEVAVVIAKARALCRGGSHSEGLKIYRSLMDNHKLDGKWYPQTGLGKALWESGDVEGSVSVLVNVIQSSADLGVKLDAVRVVIHICVEEGKLTECGGLIDTACRQAHASQIEGEAKRMLPDFYLALLAGAYKIGRADLASAFAKKSRACSREFAIPEAAVASQIYLIRHLALLSAESSDPRAIKSRIREAVHTAPWDLEARSYLTTEAAKSSLVSAEALYSSDEDTGRKAVCQLKVDTSTMKSFVRREPHGAERWCSLSLLLLWAAQESPAPELFNKSLIACKAALRLVQSEKADGLEAQNTTFLEMQLLTILSECLSHLKLPNHEVESVKSAQDALNLARSLGDMHCAYARAHLGRIYLHHGNVGKGEELIRDGAVGGCRAGAMELIALLTSQGRDLEAKEAIQKYNESS